MRVTSNSPNACNLSMICPMGAEKTCNEQSMSEKKKSSSVSDLLGGSEDSNKINRNHLFIRAKTRARKGKKTSGLHFTFFSMTQTPIVIFLSTPAPSSIPILNSRSPIRTTSSPLSFNNSLSPSRGFANTQSEIRSVISKKKHKQRRNHVNHGRD